MQSYIITVTSKGQATIPKKFRDQLNLGKKVKMSVKNDQIVIEKPFDFATSKGSLHKYAKGEKPLSDHEMDEIIGKSIAEEYANSLKNS